MGRWTTWLLVVALGIACKSGGAKSEPSELEVQSERCRMGSQIDCDTVADRLIAAGETAKALPLLIKGCRLSQVGGLGLSIPTLPRADKTLNKSALCKRAETAGAKPIELYPPGALRPGGAAGP